MRLVPDRVDRYRIVEPIAGDGMGAIYKARDLALDRLVALKFIPADSEESCAQVVRGAHACAPLNHPNIVTVYGTGEGEGRPFIVMELLDGEDLEHVIASRRPLALGDKLEIMIQVCDGLGHAHGQGIVHRDIKPSSIFLTRTGWVKILDFGTTRVADGEKVATPQSAIRGLRYAAPERASGRMDHRSDIFSVGAVFYEFLSMDELDRGIPSTLAAVIDRALRKDPAERFPDLSLMRLALERVRQTLAAEATPSPAGAPASTRRAPATNSARRRRIGALAMAAGGALAVVGLGAVLWRSPAPSTVSSVQAPARQERRESATPPRANGGLASRQEAHASQGPDAGPPAAPARAKEATFQPAPPAADVAVGPLTVRQAITEVLEARNPEHSVIATVLSEPVRIGQDVGFSIGSSRPGYVYVMAVRGDGSGDGAEVVLLFPNPVHSDNRIEPGHPLMLSGPWWPLKVKGPAGAHEFLAIVSDEPRDFDAFMAGARSLFRSVRLDRALLHHAGMARRQVHVSNPLFGGTIACIAALPCSASYGAVVFSVEAMAPERGTVHSARRVPATPPPARHVGSPRCSDLLERASLGEPLTDDEQVVLTRDCR